MERLSVSGSARAKPRMEKHVQELRARLTACTSTCVKSCLVCFPCDKQQASNAATHDAKARRPRVTSNLHRPRASTCTVRKSLCFPEEFPLYAVKASDVVALDRMTSHETLQDAGTGVLVEWDASMGPLIFVSHQWAAFTEPDPDRTQFDLLVYMLNNLHLVTDMKASAPSRMIMQQGRSLKELNWANAYVWLDLWSVPQERHALLDQRAAIRSIPAYVEQAAFLLVLAPPVQHRELRETVDLASWGNRGWVRAPQLESSPCALRQLAPSVV